MKNCCEFVENGYMDCQKCYDTERKEIIEKKLDSDLYKKFLKGEKLSSNEINLLKMEVKNIKKELI
ncbi:MAG: hypothetical protein IKG40_03585 [Bacilli bacterium]|nr:hypothetical protein [Bacilli bacterium]